MHPNTDSIVEQLRGLTAGWNGTTSKPITEEALHVVSQLQIVPVGDGGIQIEWNCNGQEVELEISPEGLVAGLLLGTT